MLLQSFRAVWCKTTVEYIIGTRRLYEIGLRNVSYVDKIHYILFCNTPSMNIWAVWCQTTVDGTSDLTCSNNWKQSWQYWLLKCWILLKFYFIRRRPAHTTMNYWAPILLDTVTSETIMFAGRFIYRIPPTLMKLLLHSSHTTLNGCAQNWNFSTRQLGRYEAS